MKRVIFLLFCFIFITIKSVKALENEYILATITEQRYQKIDTYSSLAGVSYDFQQKEDDHTNLVIMKNKQVLKMQSGIVEFKTNKACTLRLEFNKDNGQVATINGCYGVDALYLDSNIYTNKVRFLLAGTVGEIDADKVILHPFNMVKVRLSSYHVRNKILYHSIKSQLKNNFYLTNIALGEAPSYLKEDTIYYSYNGHYFYTNFLDMSKDEQNNTHALSLNNNAPYYSYFQYLPFRTISNYDSSDLEKYFKNVYHYNNRINYFLDNDGDRLNDFFNQSQFVNQYANFVACQYRYGVNALLLQSIAMLESGNGKSLMSYKENNLFAASAYDTPSERSNQRYNSVASSIQSFAKYYISRLFSTPNSAYYQGSFLGDKHSGANVKYSSDPYWGEKIAEYYYKIDKYLGGKDYNAYALALIEAKQITIYKDAFKNEILTKIEGPKLFSFVLLKELNDVYKIQLEASGNDKYEYDFQKQVGYIDKQLVQYILNKDKIQEKDYVSLHFLNEERGKQVTNSLFIPKNRKIEFLKPNKKGFDFVTYKPKISIAKEETTFTSLFKEVKRMQVQNMPLSVRQHQPLDLRNVFLNVTYKDNTHKIIKLNSDYVLNYDSEKVGHQNLTIVYADKEIKLPIYVQEDNGYLKASIIKRLDNLLKESENNKDLNKEELFTLQKEIINNDINLDLETLRHYDALLKRENAKHVSYGLIDNENLDLSVSGLNLAFNITPKDYGSFFWRDVFTLKSAKANRRKKQILKVIAHSYGYKEIKVFDLVLLKNLIKTKPLSSFIVQIKANNPNKIYTVLMCDKNNNVYSLKTTRTRNYVRFLARENGTYILLEKDSSDFYNLKDIKEVVNKENSISQPFRLFFQISVLSLLSLINLILYFIQKMLLIKEKALWSVYKKLLLKEDIVPEEKLKN